MIFNEGHFHIRQSTTSAQPGQPNVSGPADKETIFLTTHKSDEVQAMNQWSTMKQKIDKEKNAGNLIVYTLATPKKSFKF